MSKHPFSAIKYSRLVRVLPSGKRQFLRNEAYPVKLARDNEGRIYLQYMDLGPPCDQLSQRIPPPCLAWGAFVFDPLGSTITHWPEGELAGHASVVFKITGEESGAVEAATSEMPEEQATSDVDGESVMTEDLGKKTIEGIVASGKRITTSLSHGQSGAARTKTIHEEWRSEDMRLILKVIDGDPAGVEKISGLERVSLQPDPSLFSSPDGYEITYRNTAGEFVNRDLTAIQDWFVVQTAPSAESAP